MRRDLDESALTRTATLGERLRALRGDNRVVMGMTIGVLLVVVPAVVLVALLATGNATDGGGILLLLALLAAGSWLLGAGVWQAGSTSGLISFARANDLVSLGGSMATHYAGRDFADASYAVHQGVRTRGEPFVEVGDRVTVAARRVAYAQARPQVYLRVRHPGLSEPGRGPLPADLLARIESFAGPFLVEVSAGEMTLLGTRPLEPSTPGRVVEGFAIADALTEETVRRAEPLGTGAGGPSLAKAPGPDETARVRGPWVVVLWTLALLVVVPLAIAAVLSVVDDQLTGNKQGARAVVGVVLLAVFALVGWLVRVALTPRRRGRRGSDPSD